MAVRTQGRSTPWRGGDAACLLRKLHREALEHCPAVVLQVRVCASKESLVLGLQCLVAPLDKDLLIIIVAIPPVLRAGLAAQITRKVQLPRGIDDGRLELVDEAP